MRQTFFSALLMENNLFGTNQAVRVMTSRVCPPVVYIFIWDIFFEFYTNTINLTIFSLQFTEIPLYKIFLVGRSINMFKPLQFVKMSWFGVLKNAVISPSLSVTSSKNRRQLFLGHMTTFKFPAKYCVFDSRNFFCLLFFMYKTEKCQNDTKQLCASVPYFTNSNVCQMSQRKPFFGQ